MEASPGLVGWSSLWMAKPWMKPPCRKHGMVSGKLLEVQDSCLILLVFLHLSLSPAMPASSIWRNVYFDQLMPSNGTITLPRGPVSENVFFRQTRYHEIIWDYFTQGASTPPLTWAVLIFAWTSPFGEPVFFRVLSCSRRAHPSTIVLIRTCVTFLANCL